MTRDGMVVMSSEAGVLDIPEQNIVRKWRLQPGKMFLIDLEQGRIIDDEELKNDLATAHNYRRRLDKTQIELGSLRSAVRAMSPDPETLLKTQQAFGYTQEDIKFLLMPMIADGAEAIGSMGTDSPPPVLSDRSKPLANYFKQNFAQVTNPPIDPIREQLVMSLLSLIGPRPNLLGHDDGGHDMRLTVPQPILTNNELERIRQIEDHTNGAFRTRTVDICFPASQGAGRMEGAIDDLCAQAERAVRQRGANILILSDRRMDAKHVAIPALLATSAVHHHLLRKGLRTESGLVVETGACLEVHHAATLAGYGAEAINPYLAFDTLHSLLPRLEPNPGFDKAQSRYIAALGAGLKKVMSKMGISTYQSYCGAQILMPWGCRPGWSGSIFAAPPPRSKELASRKSPKMPAAGIATDMATTRCTGIISTPAATTHTACAAKPMRGIPTPSPNSSRPHAATAPKPSKNFRGRSTGRTKTCST